MKRRRRWLITCLAIPLLCIAIRPFVIERLLDRAASYVSFYEFSAASAYYRRALFFDRDNFEALDWLGYMYLNMEDVDSAVATYERALELYPNDLRALFNIGFILAMHKKDDGAACTYLERVRSISPDAEHEISRVSTDPYKSNMRLLAGCYERLGRHADALEVLEQLKNRYPNDESLRKRIENVLGYDAE